MGRPADDRAGARRADAAIPGAPILADVKASQVLFDEIARAGGKPVMSQTGHSLIKAQLAETGAPLAGEMSGHIFFADRYYGFDDAVYVAVRLLGHPRARRREPRRDARQAAAGVQHARAAPAVRRGAQIRRGRGGPRPAAPARRRGRRYRRGAGARPRTAGGCCAPRTPRRSSSRAPNRRARPGSTASSSSLRRNSRQRAGAARD